MINLRFKLAALMMCLASGLYGQENSRTIGFGLEVQPKIVSQVFENSSLAESAPSLGGAFTGTVFFDISPTYTLKTGLGINLMQMDYKDYKMILPCDIHNQGIDSLNSWSEVKQTVTYLTIPVSNRIAFSQNKNRFYLQAGIEALIKIASSGTFDIMECGIDTGVSSKLVYDYSPLTVTGNLGIGYEWAFSGTGKIYVEPGIAYSLNSVFREINEFDNINDNRIFNAGLAVGIRFR
ncbi:MAG: outer membrane beta-barrel protein [Bacteroidia bacterium]